MSDFLAYGLKSLVQFLQPAFEALCDGTPNLYDSFKETLELYEGGLKLPGGALFDQLKQNVPFELLKELIRTDGEGYFKFPMPQVIKGIIDVPFTFFRLCMLDGFTEVKEKKTVRKRFLFLRLLRKTVRKIGETFSQKIIMFIMDGAKLWEKHKVK